LETVFYKILARQINVIVRHGQNRANGINLYVDGDNFVCCIVGIYLGVTGKPAEITRVAQLETRIRFPPRPPIDSGTLR